MDTEEELHFHECIIAFREYYQDINSEFYRQFLSIKALDMNIYSKYLAPSLEPTQRLKKLSELGEINQSVLNLMIENNIDINDAYIKKTISPFLLKNESNGSDSKPREKVEKKGKKNVVPECEIYTKPHMATKIRSLLHQISREWSSEGEEERKECFAPIIQQLEKHVKIGSRVLCPGVGLGRLLVEILSHGYSCQGNEFSYIMLFASDFILNYCNEPNEFTIFPWIDSNINNFKYQDKIRPVTFPDISIKEYTTKGKQISPNVRLSMVAGEFLSVYQPDKSSDEHSKEDLKFLSSWDSIVTCFFLDTAYNVIDYIKRIYDLLKPGGIWINHGPLLWHWYAPNFNSEQGSYQIHSTDKRYQASIELSYDEIKYVIQQVGFEILYENRHKMGYSCNHKSMMQTIYNTVIFTCIKK